MLLTYFAFSSTKCSFVQRQEFCGISTESSGALLHPASVLSQVAKALQLHSGEDGYSRTPFTVQVAANAHSTLRVFLFHQMQRNLDERAWRTVRGNCGKRGLTQKVTRPAMT